jgi:hypothetical protein
MKGTGSIIIKFKMGKIMKIAGAQKGEGLKVKTEAQSREYGVYLRES